MNKKQDIDTLNKIIAQPSTGQIKSIEELYTLNQQISKLAIRI